MSRVAFYTCYDNKYELLDDCFQDVPDAVGQHFSGLQKNNRLNDAKIDYYNLLEAIMDIYYISSGTRSGR